MYVSSPLSLFLFRFRFRFLVFSLLEQENANTPNVLGIYENSPRSPMFSNFTGLYMKSLCSPLLELMRVCVLRTSIWVDIAQSCLEKEANEERGRWDHVKGLRFVKSIKERQF